MFSRGSKGVPVGKIMGIPISLDYSWFAIVALLTWSLGGNYFPNRLDGYSDVVYYGLGLVSSVLLFASVFAHEVGHSVAALWYDVPVKRIRLTFLGGLAELGKESSRPIVEFVIAIAGPAVSLLSAGVFFLANMILGNSPLMANMALFEPISAVLWYLAILNGLLTLFNLIPGFPLDGGRVLRAILWAVTGDQRRGTIIAANVGRLVAFGFIGLGIVEIVMGSTASGLWTIFIGMFLNSAATSQIQYQRVRSLLLEYSVDQAMRRDFVYIPATITLEQIASNAIYGLGRRTFLVRRGEQPIGYLTMKEFEQVDRGRWAYTTTEQAMRPFAADAFVTPDTVLWNALRMMDVNELNQLPVVTDNGFSGLIRREDVLRFAQFAQSMGARTASA